MKKTLKIVMVTPLIFGFFTKVIYTNKVVLGLGPSKGIGIENESIISDFDSSNPLSQWTFTSSPKASGSLTLGEGHVGHGAQLSYDLAGLDLSTGQYYVSATRILSSTLNGQAISFWVKSPPGVRLILKLGNNIGDIFSLELNRPFYATDPDAWYRQVVNINNVQFQKLTIETWVQEGAQASGAIEFDDVALMSSLAFRLDPATLITSPAPRGSGRLSSILGVNMHFHESAGDPGIAIAAAAGIKRVRTDLFWGNVETSRGKYNFSQYDEILTLLESHGMKAHFILDYGNPLYTGGWQSPPTTQTAIQAFGNFAEAAAKHFAGHGVTYEIWNEPNFGPFWPPQPNATQYVTLAGEAIARIHQGDPSAKVSTGGLFQFDYNFLQAYLNDGGGQNADAIGVHPYDPSILAYPESISGALLLMHNRISQTLKTNLPIWNTESGISSFAGTLTEDQARAYQALMVSREILSGWSAGFPMIVYYELRDEGTDPNNYSQNYGLIDYNYQDKPAMQAVRTLTSFVHDRVLTGLIHTVPTSLHVLRLDGAKDVAFIVWSDDPTSVTITMPDSMTAMNYLGGSIALTPTLDGQSLTLSSSDGPFYLTCTSCTSIFTNNIALPVIFKGG